MSTELKLLHRLARSYAVQTMHRDGFARPVVPSPEIILRVLRILGAPVEHMNDVGQALRERRLSLWRRGLEPVLVAWAGAPLEIKLRLPAKWTSASVHYEIALENGATLRGQCHDNPQRPGVSRLVEGTQFSERPLRIPAVVPIGYHRLELAVGMQAFDALLICAPEQSYDALTALHRPWGIFAPTYALENHATWGAGDFSSLESLAEFAAGAGAKFIGTLPMLAAFLDEPFDPSPYAAVSRLFWNEFYLAIDRIPELQYSPAARRLMNSAEFRNDIARAHAAPLIDYRRIMALKRRVLETLLNDFLNQTNQRRAAFEARVASDPNLQDYAAFRARVERERKSWLHWQDPARRGHLDNEESDRAARNYHLFVQWLAIEQMEELRTKTRKTGTALYLDFPLGVNRDGYDVWRNQDLFALSVSAGAPPDSLFVGGQNWGFPPFDPQALRERNYRYYIDSLRHHLRHADLLRIDHVMGLHRMYWIPEGCAAVDGVYVHYRAEEFYAVLSLESHRQHGQIVGENLGTVPDYANAALARHRILGLHVGQFAVDTNADSMPAEIPHGKMASLNTHDTPTFAGFWQGSDIQDRRELGLLNEAQIAQEQAHRDAQRHALVDFLHRQKLLAANARDPLAILQAWLCFMAANGADVLLVNLEDLWLEAQPQNVPGTWDERPNWRRKARHSLAAARQMSTVMDILSALNQTTGERSDLSDG